MSGNRARENDEKKRGADESLDSLEECGGNRPKRSCGEQFEGQGSAEAEDQRQWRVLVRPASPMNLKIVLRKEIPGRPIMLTHEKGPVNLPSTSLGKYGQVVKSEAEGAVMKCMEQPKLKKNDKLHPESNLTDPQNRDEMEQVEKVKVMQERETMHLLNLLPEDVWIMVLKDVKDPNVLRNLCHVHPLFREILGGWGNRWNFLLFRLAFPCLEPYLPVQNIKQVRGMCRSWKNSVDECLEFQIPEVTSHSSKGVKTTDRKFKLKCSDSSPSTQLLADPPATFVGGCVEVEIRRDFFDGNLPVFFEEQSRKIIDLIVRCGVDRVVDRVVERGEYLPCLEILQCIYYVLERTPNLKKLEIRVERLSMNHKLAEVVQLLEERPFPRLPQLAYLLLEIGPNPRTVRATRPIARKLLETYGNQVQHLLLFRLELPPASLEMNALTNLSVWITFDDELEDLRLLQAAKLKKIYLSTRYPDNRMSTLFPVLQEFENSLEDLHLEVCWGDGLPTGVQIPLLKKLKINRLKITDWTDFDFLLRFPRMNQVDIGFEPQSFFTEGGVLKPDYLNEDGTLNQVRFKESPIWEKRPYLDIKIKELTREAVVGPSVRTRHL